MTQLLQLLALAAVEEAQTHAPAAAEAGHQAAEHAAEHGPAQVLMHHVLDQQPFYGFPSKHLLFFGIVAVLVIVIVRLALRQYDSRRVPRGLGAAVESLVVFIRDDIAEKNIGHDGHKFVSLLCSFFFFILTAALFGLLPYSATSTGNLSVTLALATISFLAQQWGGISKNGVVGHFGHLVPAGMPVFLLPIMIPVEILSMFTKPFALMVRLFANMLAGHMVITALLMLIPLMAQIHVAAGLAIAPVSLLLALFIMMLELLVAFIQAYIFTLLTAQYVASSLAEDH